MREVTWLHISDLHIRNSDSWSRDAVLDAMLRYLHSGYSNGLAVDFVLISGDLAFSGEKDQYDLVAQFLIQLSDTLKLARDKIYCVPGNHDVQRDRQRMCFAGARQKLESVNDVYSFLNNTDERATLTSRLNNYLEFEGCFFRDQVTIRTSDELGYVSVIEIEDFRIAILGLNTAWLAEGGDDDDRHILLGEPQVNDAIRIAQETKPHVLIAMQHHPFDILRRFDQHSTQNLLEQTCQYLHCGHLHYAYTHETTRRSGHCVTLAAGASYESRGFRNSFTIVKLDPLNGRTDVKFVQFDPKEGAFTYQSNREFQNYFYGVTDCTARELSSAITTYCSEAVPFSNYFASLLLGSISEVPIVTQGATVFGSLELLKSQTDDELSDVTFSFLTVGRAIALLFGRKHLQEILADHGQPVVEYCRVLISMSTSDHGLMSELTSRNENARKLADTDSPGRFQHTLDLLEHLYEEQEWDQLIEVAERTIELKDRSVSAIGKRMLAHCLARSTEGIVRERAIKLYDELRESEDTIPEDWGKLAVLLINTGHFENAKVVIESGITKFPEKLQEFIDIGHELVLATGDTDFRDRLRAINQ